MVCECDGVRLDRTQRCQKPINRDCTRLTIAISIYQEDMAQVCRELLESGETDIIPTHRNFHKEGRMFRSAGTLTRTQPLLRLFLRSQSSNALTKSALPFTYSSEGPATVKYTAQHEWIAAHNDGTAFVGITKYAADALGDATYIELPEAETELEKGESLGSVESVKSASEIYQPVGATVIESNSTLDESPQLINEDPMGAAWIAKVKLNDLKDLESQDLFSLDQYQQSLSHDDH